MPLPSGRKMGESRLLHGTREHLGGPTWVIPDAVRGQCAGVGGVGSGEPSCHWWSSLPQITGLSLVFLDFLVSSRVVELFWSHATTHHPSSSAHSEAPILLNQNLHCTGAPPGMT